MNRYDYAVIIVASLAVIVLAAGWNAQRQHTLMGQLERNEQRWNAQGYTSYRYELQVISFGTIEELEPIVVNVRDGAPVSLLRKRDGTPAKAQFFAGTDTIPELFQRIRSMINAEPDQLTIQYDSSSGYPVYVAVDYDREAVDDEITIRVYDLTATTP